jgi:hypothetical protein
LTGGATRREATHHTGELLFRGKWLDAYLLEEEEEEEGR